MLFRSGREGKDQVFTKLAKKDALGEGRIEVGICEVWRVGRMRGGGSGGRCGSHAIISVRVMEATVINRVSWPDDNRRQWGRCDSGRVSTPSCASAFRSAARRSRRRHTAPAVITPAEASSVSYARPTAASQGSPPRGMMPTIASTTRTPMAAPPKSSVVPNLCMRVGMRMAVGAGNASASHYAAAERLVSTTSRNGHPPDRRAVES